MRETLDISAAVVLTFWLGIVSFAATNGTHALLAASPDEKMIWKSLPDLPDAEGFAGMFAGVCGGKLLAAGGANFRDRRPWNGGVKHWSDEVWLLPAPTEQWRKAGRLPRPTAYGVSATTVGGTICAGGGDATGHWQDAYLLQATDGKLVIRPLPQLPRRCSFASGALVGNMLYISGGIERPDATECLRVFWALDTQQALAASEEAPQANIAWRELEPCPGPERMLAVAAAVEESFYLFSGARLRASATGPPTREYLRDAWRFQPDTGWRRLAEMPRAAVAAPSPAARTRDGRLLVISGDDGANVGFKPETAHPGFPRNVLAYDPARDAWTQAGEVSFSRATAPTTVWNGFTMIPSGESRPGYRSPQVWGMMAPAK